MKTSLTVIIEGRAHFTPKGWADFPSTVLVQTDRHTILVDPGVDEPKLMESLRKRGIQKESITHVFVTHMHFDHCLLAHLFQPAPIVLGDCTYLGATGTWHDGTCFGTDVEILRSRGHTTADSCLLVHTNAKRILVAGDLFWWDTADKQEITRRGILTHPDPFAFNQSILEKERKQLMDRADIIIPGHGSPFIPPHI